MSTDAQSSSWERMDLQQEDKQICLRAVRERYPKHTVKELDQQGCCSVTLVVIPPSQQLSLRRRNDSGHHNALGFNDDVPIIVQLRPAQYAFDLDIAKAAKNMYPSLAPDIRPLGLDIPGRLCAYEMEMLYGTPLSRLLPRSRKLDAETTKKLESLMTSFADFIAKGWEGLPDPGTPHRNVRADSPINDQLDMLSRCSGKVGSSLVRRLEQLARKLPDAWLRKQAKTQLDSLLGFREDYPVVLNHGDLIPTNILVDEETWEITGLVDWAEAEYLPFGTCFYGLEHLLGYFSCTAQSPVSTSDNSYTDGSFTYYENAPQLRDIFWSCLIRERGFLSRRVSVLSARDIGVLLWHGIAWDDGAIDRVVNEVDDAKEIACLRAFLGNG